MPKPAVPEPTKAPAPRPASAVEDGSAASRKEASDPWRAVLALGSRRLRWSLLIGLAGGLVVHGAAAGHGYRLSDLLQLRSFSLRVSTAVHDRLRTLLEVEVDEPPKPEPEPEPDPEPEPEPAPKAEPTPPPKEAPVEPPKAAPPPPAAEAGKVLTAEPDPNEPLDLTGDVGFVSGTGERYVGGVTASRGKGQSAVYNRGASPEGVQGGKGTVPAPAAVQGPDLSRKAKPAPNSRLSNCPFPPEADVEQIDSANVEVLISFDAQGKVTGATVLRDPGFGFGREVQRCALREPPFIPALDRGGKPIAGSIKFNIRFRRN